MHEIEALHTAARRYCLARHQLWTTRYADLRRGREHRVPYSYTRQDRDTFPRYHVMDAVRIEIERWVPEDFDSLTETLDLLVAAAQSATTIFTQNLGEIEQRATDNERQQLIAYLRSLGSQDLLAIQPLPYRRTLSKEEGDRLRGKLLSVWGASDYWYPLARSERTDVEAFQPEHFWSDGAAETLGRLLDDHGVKTVFEISEGEHDWEVSLGSVDWLYDGEEKFWCDSRFEWVIYASHENSITIGGWPLAAAQALWPEWSTRVWSSPF